MTEHHFRILEVDLTLSGPDEILEPILFAYRRFARTPETPRGSTGVVLALPGDGTLEVDGRPVPLIPDVATGVQLHHRLHTSLMDAIGSCAVVHAAGLVDPRGDGLVLAAPSGHGKSSLALELVQRGLGFLSDDFAPLDLEQGLVRAFPRAAAVAVGDRSPLDGPLRATAVSASCKTVFGKSLIDIGDVLGDSALASGPAPLRHLFLLASGESPPYATTLLDLVSRAEDADELHERFSRTDGVEVVRQRRGPHLGEWRLRLNHERGPTEALADVLDGERILYFAKSWDVRPDFKSAPEATPIKRREAAAHLGRELLNRRRRGKLLARYGGSLPRLFVDLASALRNTRCWQLRVGDLARTADLVERLAG